jgi:hypothetical protein
MKSRLIRSSLSASKSSVPFRFYLTGGRLLNSAGGFTISTVRCLSEPTICASKHGFPVEIIEFSTYVNDKGQKVHRFDPFLADVEAVNVETASDAPPHRRPPIPHLGIHRFD